MKNNKMQKALFIFFALIILIAAVIAVNYALSSNKPEKVVENFYQSWVNQKDSPLATEFYKNHTSLTKKLEDNIQETIDSFDKGAVDPILCAQDKPREMSYDLINKTDNSAIVEIKENFGGNSQTVKVGLVKNASGWLIDEIICPNKNDNDLSASETDAVGDYIKDNIADLSPEDPVLGGNFYVTKIDFVSPGVAIVNYEDGHIALKAQADYEINGDNIEISNFEINDNDLSASETDAVGDYIKDNIADLSPEDPVLGGNFYVTKIDFVSPGVAIVNYEDGHIALEAQAEYEIKGGEVEINEFNIQE